MTLARPCDHCHSRGRHNKGCPAVKPRPPCRHCQRRPAYQARQLCRPCWSVLSVRQQYPPIKDCTGSGALPDFDGEPPRPLFFTQAAPGSEAKLRVLEERAAHGLQLFHDDDAQLDLR